MDVDDSSTRGDAGSEVGDDEPRVLRCHFGLGGELIGTVELQPDVSIGHFKSKLLDILRQRDPETSLEWFQGKTFIMGEPPVCHDFHDDCMKFLDTESVKTAYRSARADPGNQGDHLLCTIIRAKARGRRQES